MGNRASSAGGGPAIGGSFSGDMPMAPPSGTAMPGTSGAVLLAPRRSAPTAGATSRRSSAFALDHMRFRPHPDQHGNPLPHPRARPRDQRDLRARSFHYNPMSSEDEDESLESETESSIDNNNSNLREDMPHTHATAAALISAAFYRGGGAGLAVGAFGRGIKCPICRTTCATGDSLRRHLLQCLNTPRITYNVDTVLPTHSYVKDSEECSICLEEYTEGEQVARLPCFCIFHKTCIDAWFKVSRTCPQHPEAPAGAEDGSADSDWLGQDMTSSGESPVANSADRRRVCRASTDPETEVGFELDNSISDSEGGQGAHSDSSPPHL